ncbi:Probable 1-acylglycerol-3-phosphate O-acyltransferase [Galdieria sulphuraria]|uniref:Hydrolase, alpha/beta fold family protein n=1 Tax=Galdieria sulphuraria TaxID=130081 RepID=M2Y7E1_GALSU|nr:hydrolase, alpha/beta fold family protein [Galdieria sulphuraria]EME31754.1 hydrolase, alpha/beta fold family protein [Galdieria sulphuraria]GJD10554.1 Probable 1-acylglycerol-3-phosphate O-acyltransferase [Galdieria sulphuraria]|eukprot:XP_005708274.1 hydrolase, alpha/beta fold family protein [Galdieria sulphuraria]
MPTSPERLKEAERKVLERVKVSIEHEFVRAGNYMMHVIVAGRGNRKTIVLLHGHSMSAAFFYRNLEQLVSIGYCAYAIDLLGWGRSDRPEFKGRTAEESIAYYVDSLQLCLQSVDLRQFALLGHSLGAYVAVQYTLKNPTSVTRLILISPAGIERKVSPIRALYFAFTPQLLVRRGGLLGYLGFIARYPRQPGFVAPGLRKLAYQLNAQPKPSGDAAVVPLVSLRGFSNAQCLFPLVECIERLRVPVHLVCGDLDPVVKVSEVKHLYELLKVIISDCHFTVIRGSDHCAFLEYPDEFFNAVFHEERQSSSTQYSTCCPNDFTVSDVSVEEGSERE